MKQNITVDKAILEGKKRINYPIIFILLASVVGFSYLALTFSEELGITPSNKLPLGMSIGLIIGILTAKQYWKIESRKWQFWAFQNVRNVHELKRKAIQEKIIKDNFILNLKTRRGNYEEQRIIKIISKKFEELDKHYDDLTIDKQTVIRTSKFARPVLLFMGSFAVGTSVYSFFMFSIELYKLVITFVLGFFFFVLGVLLNDKESELIIDSKGIKIYEQEFLSWNLIYECYVERRQENNHYANYLILIKENSNNKMEFRVDGLDVKPKKIQEMIQIYMLRFRKENSIL